MTPNAARIRAWLAVAMASGCLVCAAGAQATGGWVGSVGPVEVVPNAPTDNGFVLGLSVRVSRSVWSTGPFSIGLDARGHLGKAAGFGDFVCTTGSCNPVYGHIPWTAGLGPGAEYAVEYRAVAVIVRGFASATWGGVNHLSNQGVDGSFNTTQTGAALGVRWRRILVELEGSQLGTVRQMHPSLWTARFGRTW